MAEKIIPSKREFLTNRHFTPRANQLNYESEIATYIVPAKKVIEIPADYIRLKLMTGEEFSFTTGTNENSKTLTLTYPIAKDPRLPLKAANAGDSACVIVVRTTPSPVTEWVGANVTVTEPKTVVLSGLTASTAYVFKVYYLFDDGTVKLTIRSSDETQKKDILVAGIGEVNRIDQENIKAGLQVGGVGQNLPERWKLELRVKTAAPVFLYGETESGNVTPYARVSRIRLPVLITNQEDWGTNVEAIAKATMLAY